MSRSSKSVASAMACCVAATNSSGAAVTSNRAVSCRRTPRSAWASSSRTSTSSAFFRLDSDLRSSAVDSGCFLAGTGFFGLRLGMVSIPFGVHFVRSLDSYGTDIPQLFDPSFPLPRATARARAELLGQRQLLFPNGSSLQHRPHRTHHIVSGGQEVHFCCRPLEARPRLWMYNASSAWDCGRRADRASRTQERYEQDETALGSLREG